MWFISSIADSLKVSSFVNKFNICISSSKTRQSVILLGIDGLKLNSIEKVLGEKSSDGTNLEATLANRLASWFWNLGMKFILKYSKF